MHILTFRQRIQKILAFAVCTCAAIALGSGSALAAHSDSLSITSAQWNASKNELTVKGSSEPGVQITISNAFDTGIIIDQLAAGGNHKYTSKTKPGDWTPAQQFEPCRVHVEAFIGGQTLSVELDVTNATANCFPSPGGQDPVCTIDTPANDPVQINTGQSVNYTGTATDDGTVESYAWVFGGGTPAASTAEDPGAVLYSTAGTYQTTFEATDNDGGTCATQTRTVEVSDPGGPPAAIIQRDFKMMMNYELGMHCTGFEFAYCCVLPAYNSILMQITKDEDSMLNQTTHPYILKGDPDSGRNLDLLGRETVVRDLALDDDDKFQKYVFAYEHHAQPRNDGKGKIQTDTFISNVEGNSLLSWNTRADAATRNAGDGLLTGSYNGAKNVVLGDGDYGTLGNTFGVPIDNYQNAVFNHLYIYEISARGVEGYRTGDTTDGGKLYLGLDVDYPTNVGPAGHRMGPDAAGGVNPGSPGAAPGNLLTFSADTGTVVFTQMKVLEDLPIMLTAPDIWEALGLPLTPFEDSIDFFLDPGLVDEDSIRPYVQMTVSMYHANCPQTGPGNCSVGNAVLDSAGDPVQGFGTAPIDIPNCERCHSAFDAPNSPNVTGTPEAALVQLEIDFWKAYYDIVTPGDADWYARLKGAAISILGTHDTEHGTAFLANTFPASDYTAGLPFAAEGGLWNVADIFPGAPAKCLVNKAPTGNVCTTHADCGGGTDGICDIPQNTRTGTESVICQKCHADNVIAVVKSANCDSFTNLKCSTGSDPLIPALTEAIHYNHRNVTEGGTITFNDTFGRDGGCQGCHPAHRSDGDMEGYPIDLDGNNFYANSDNRDANGGCFVGRDVHSNPLKDAEATTASHLNPVGQYLQTAVANDTGNWKGIWCTNCHNQATQEIWKAENVADLINAQPGDPGNVRMPVSGQPHAGELVDVVNAVNAALGTGYSEDLFKAWLDPKTTNTTEGDLTHAVWDPDPGLCDYVNSYLAPGTYGPVKAAHDANVAVVEVSVGTVGECSTGNALDANGDGVVDGSDKIGCAAAAFFLCGSYDSDPGGANPALGDFSVSLVGNTLPDAGPFGGAFCTTPDCVASAQATLGSTVAVPVPFSAATDGRDHWLASGEPHCADCHLSPYTEQSGNISAYPPFNYPRKASLMRYTKGHRGLACQSCHESIHGLYPVTPPGFVSAKAVDQTSWDQAGALNEDGSHGPLKCDTCHEAGGDGIPNWVRDLTYTFDGVTSDVAGNFDTAVSWMHTYTAETSPLEGVCLNCHGVKGNNWDAIDSNSKKWVEHTYRNKVSRISMNQAELNSPQGHFSGDPDFEDPLATVCVACHRDRQNKVSCNSKKWKQHLITGRAAEPVWEYVSELKAGSTCGW